MVLTVSSRRMKVLLVALAFPPKQDAEVLQTAKLHKYLSALPEVDLHVVTSAESARLSTLLAPQVQTEAGVTRFDVFSSRYMNYAALRFMPGFASRPDIKRGAIARAEAISKALPWRPDIVLSRSYPISSALLGQAIAMHFDAPWIMQLSDPWSLSPLHPPGYALEWNRARERAVFARAARVTFTSTRTMANYARLYPFAADRLRYYPNTYDPDQNRPNPWQRGEKFRIVYAGTLGGTRRPDVFCAAIEAFLYRVPAARDRTTFVIAGHADRAVRTALAQRPEYLDWRGPVSFDVAMDLIRSADILALIDNIAAPRADQAGQAGEYEFFPSKLLDYMLGQRPILGVTAQGSIAHEVIDTLGLGQCFDHFQVEELSAVIERKWHYWEVGQASEFEFAVQDSTYDAKAVAQRLYEEMESLLNDT